MMSHSRDRHRAKNTLVVVQVSLALVLLISSGLMIRTFQAMRSVRMGFEQPDALQTFRVVVPGALVPKEEEAARIQEAIAEKLATISGVTAVGFARALPTDGAPPNWDGILSEGQSYAQGNRPPMRLYLNVSPGLFGSLGTRLKAGRDFTWTDVYGDRKFVLVSEIWLESCGDRLRPRWASAFVPPILEPGARFWAWWRTCGIAVLRNRRRRSFTGQSSGRSLTRRSRLPQGLSHFRFGRIALEQARS
jgi:hypothetical protein